MKKILKYLIIALFMITVLKDYANALKPKEAPHSNVENKIMKKSGLDVESRSVMPISRPEINYQSTGKRNPFEQPSVFSDKGETDIPVPVEMQLPSLTVQGIIWEGNYKQAIINNRVVKIGDIIENADVVDINKEGVTVLFAGVEYKLSTITALGQQE